jgi:hypothetical protein
MIQKHSWVCSECGQGLTRKNSANRHNNNLHSGQAAVVRPFEYIIGRLNGNFHTPKDPLTYRRRKGDDLTSKVLGDGAQQPPKINDSYTQTRQTPKTSGDTVDFTEKMLEQRLKFEELKMLYNKYYRPEDSAQMFLSVVNLEDENFLDKKLDWLRGWDNLKSGSQKVHLQIL